MIRGAGCGSPARPDLWGPRVRNHPGLPDWPVGSEHLANALSAASARKSGSPKARRYMPSIIRNGGVVSLAPRSSSYARGRLSGRIMGAGPFEALWSAVARIGP